MVSITVVAKSRRTRMRRAGILVAVGAVSIAMSDGASAGRPDAVDPGLMQPALNGSFGPWECWRNGNGVVCDGSRDWSWSAAETGLVCDGAMVYSTGTDTRTMRRVADGDGLALWTLQHVDIRETLSLSPDGTGPTLRASGHFQEHYDYPIPGDQSSRTDTYTGVDVQVNGPGVGLVFHDVGLKSFDIDDNVLAAHGPHPILEDFDGTFAKICDAFAAIGG